MGVVGIIVGIVIVGLVIYFFTPIGFLNVGLDGEYQIKITVNNKELTATMENNTSAQAFKKMLEKGPKSVNMRDYGSMEKVGMLGKGLPTNNKNITTEPGNIFGTLLSNRNSDINPEWIAKQLIAQGKEVPKMYITCGTEDPLLSSSWEVRDSFRKMGIDVTYEEQSGSHNWDFWNKAIVKALEWLPLDEPQAGLNSGNIVF